MYNLEWSLANSMLSLVTLYCWDILAVWHAIWRAPNQSIFVLVELGRIRCCPLLMIRHSLISVSVITPSLSHFWRWPTRSVAFFAAPSQSQWQPVVSFALVFGRALMCHVPLRCLSCHRPGRPMSSATGKNLVEVVFNCLRNYPDAKWCNMM